MACSNCYNGCTEIVSDKCVKYTGIDVPVLGIQNGDSLSYVEQALIEFLTSTLDGTGIKPTIDPEIICTLVQDNLPTCGDITIVDLINALIKSVCFIEEQVTALEAKFSELEQGYVIDCLEGSPDPTSTYEVLQAVINKVCGLEIDLSALALDVDTNYVKLADLNTLIQAYLDGNSPAVTQQYQKMVPYTVVEYYGDIAGNFDASGAGLESAGWSQVYLCNGNNGTPDKRGRIGVGATTGMYGGALDPVVASGPAYGLLTSAGEPYVTLTTAQIPAHTHANTATSVVSPNPHSHGLPNNTIPKLRSTDDGGSGSYDDAWQGYNNGLFTNSVDLSVTTTLNNASAGGGQSHSNIPPVLSCYYIMYIPNP